MPGRNQSLCKAIACATLLLDFASCSGGGTSGEGTNAFPPAPPETLTIISPAPSAVLPSGPVLVSFTYQNFAIGDQGTSHLHIYLDGGTTANHFFNGATNQVLNGNGQPAANITWLSTTSFQITGLPNGPHTIRLALADAADKDLQNGEANPPLLNISIPAPPGSPTLTMNNPD